jgi:hypothetical protein
VLLRLLDPSSKLTASADWVVVKESNARNGANSGRWVLYTELLAELQRQATEGGYEPAATTKEGLATLITQLVGVHNGPALLECKHRKDTQAHTTELNVAGKKGTWASHELKLSDLGSEVLQCAVNPLKRKRYEDSPPEMLALDFLPSSIRITPLMLLHGGLYNLRCWAGALCAVFVLCDAVFVLCDAV